MTVPICWTCSTPLTDKPEGWCSDLCERTMPVYDDRMSHLRVCYWCAELQRLHPHPILPNPGMVEQRPASVEEWPPGAVLALLLCGLANAILLVVIFG